MKKTRKEKCCDTKQKYKSRSQAAKTIKNLNKKKLIFRIMTPYKCKFCKQWHIGRTKNVNYEAFKRL